MSADKIRELNDAARKSLNGEVYITQGVQALHALTEVMQKVRNFDDFSEENDPHGEHDFGAFDFKGHKLFWKWDYYDKNKEFGSDDPSDPEKTTRVLTVMLAEEY